MLFLGILHRFFTVDRLTEGFSWHDEAQLRVVDSCEHNVPTLNGWCASSVVGVWPGEDSGRMTGSDGEVFIFASPGSRGTFEMIHQSFSLFVAISGSGKSFAANGLCHSSWYGMTLMTERFSSLLPPVNVEEQPREGVYRVPHHGIGGVGFSIHRPVLSEVHNS